jgi:hypothetical protein
MWLVVFDDDMMEIKLIDTLEARIDRDLREISRLSSHLLPHLFDMILIDMHIPEGMDQSSWLYSEEMR